MEFLTTNGAALLFYFFAATAVGGAVMVVTQRNPMYCAIALLVSFLSAGALFFLRHAEFLGVVQIFVYGGGIMVLFLFVIMLVNLHTLGGSKKFLRQSPVAVVLAVVMIAVFGFLLAQVDLGDQVFVAENFKFVDENNVDRGNSGAVAMTLYRDYLLPFEIASLFLLVAMIGAVVLGRRT